MAASGRSDGLPSGLTLAIFLLQHATSVSRAWHRAAGSILSPSSLAQLDISLAHALELDALLRR